MDGDKSSFMEEDDSIFMNCCCCWVTQLCPTLYDPMDCSTPASSVLHHLPEFSLIHVHWVGDANHLILCCPLLLLPLVFPSIRVFSNDSVLHIRWPKYWHFCISPSKEYSGLISFRIDWFDLHAVQGTRKSLFQSHNLKASIFHAQSSLLSNFHIYTWLLEKP